MIKTYEFNGDLKTLPEISSETGIPSYVLRERARRGLSGNELVAPVLTYEPVFYEGKFRSLSEVARMTNIYKTSLRRWMRDYNLTVEEAVKRKRDYDEKMKSIKEGTYVKKKPQCADLKKYPNPGGHIYSCAICSNTLLEEYQIWVKIKGRCFNKKNPAYSAYGGRGVTMHPEWISSFKNFYEDMGPRPSKEYSVERINNDGNYEPDNCKWATKKEQARNRRNSRFVEYDGRIMTVAEASELSGIDESCLRYRLDHGLEDRLFEESGNIKKKYLLNGKNYALSDISKLTGLSRDKLNVKLIRGESLEKIMKECSG